MNNAIIICCVGEPDKYQQCVPAAEKYCEKYNLNLELITEPKIKFDDPIFSDPIFEKLQVLNYFDKYDRILYLDADTLITPKCENVFDLFPDKNSFYAYNINLQNKDYDTTHIVKYIFMQSKEEKLVWKAAQNNKPLYFNAGVFIVSKPNYEYMLEWYEACLTIGPLWYQEQSPLNYLINKYNINFAELDSSYNYQDVNFIDHTNYKKTANIIHYAGNGFDYNKIGKYNVLKNDRIELYGF